MRTWCLRPARPMRLFMAETQKQVRLKYLPLPVVMRTVCKAKYLEGCLGTAPKRERLAHYDTVRDFVMRSFSNLTKYGQLRAK